MFGHTAQVVEVIISSGYTIRKNDVDGVWEMVDNATVVAKNQSKGDLVQKWAKELGVW